MKILFYGTRSYEKESFQKELPRWSDITIDFIEDNLTPESTHYAYGYEAVCAFVNADVGEVTLENLHDVGVRLLLMRCAGIDSVDVVAAQRLGITVAHVPSYSPYAVAEHAMGLALASNRRIHKGYIRVRENNFALDGLVGTTLSGKTVGIIGTGKIGEVFARICRGFGMRIVAYDVYPQMRLVDEGILDGYVSLKELLQSSDMISLHAFLDEHSHHIIDDAAISLMKDGVIIINTSRGGLVDTEALIRGISAGKIGAVGLDVYEEEDVHLYRDRNSHVVETPAARLCSFPNVVMTSHQAFLTEEALSNIAVSTLDNARAYARGGPLPEGHHVC